MIFTPTQGVNRNYYVLISLLLATQPQIPHERRPTAPRATHNLTLLGRTYDRVAHQQSLKYEIDGDERPNAQQHASTNNSISFPTATLLTR